MPNSSSRGGRRASTDVYVIDNAVHRSARRRAKIALIVTWIIAGVLAALALSASVNPVLAALGGALLGAVPAVVVYVAVLVWPVVRVLIWWSDAIVLTAMLVAGMTGLYQVIPGPAVIGVVLGVAGLLFGPPKIRHTTVALYWCAVDRHRLRASFADFIRVNRDGSLPFILEARPTPVGERVRVWLRPGLSLDYLRDRGDQLAVACLAKSVEVSAASSKNAALVWFDIKRRDTLSAPIGSPLVDVPDAPSRKSDTVPADPDALDLTDVTEHEVTPSTQDTAVDKKPTSVPFKPTPKPAPKPAEVPAVVSGSGEDVSDWL